MVFSSSIFLFAFLPVVLLAYFIVPGRAAKNTWLLVASLFFYAWGEPIYVVLMVVSIFLNWLLAMLMGSPGKHSEANEDDREEEGEEGVANAKRSPTQRKALLVAAVIVNVAIIGFFKYEGFLAANVNGIVGFELVPDLDLPLPIGISFYTLQALSYVIDVYRGEVEPQSNILYLGMYIACFPQLIAGPIVRYKTIQAQVVGRKETLSGFANGMRLFVVGLAKKVLLANTVAILANEMLAMGGPQIGAIGAWAGLVAYTFQIYFDFSGYSDMAIGLGRMMGFEYLRNFNYPYISRSITEFWRRWHMSLSSFFRDYIYIPLGGSRCSKARHIFNIAVVWTITGLWHGAAWNYVGWGVYYGVLLICEKYVWGRALGRMPAIVQHLYTIAIFVFGWSFFWITDAGDLVRFWMAMIGQYGATGTSTFWQLTAWEYWPVFAVCIAASLPICPFVKERFLAWVEGRECAHVREDGTVNPRRTETTSLAVLDATPESPHKAAIFTAVAYAYDICLFALLLASCASVVSGSFNPFIYFQF